MKESQFLNRIKNQLDIPSQDNELKLPTDDIHTLLTIADKYRMLHDIGKLIASEMEFNGLLRLAMDKVIEVTRAQRGFIALLENNNQLDFKVARNMETLAGRAEQLLRSVEAFKLRDDATYSIQDVTVNGAVRQISN